MKIIALFNHKGGVSKTITTFNLGWMLAEKGKRFLLVDLDPRCNLTGMITEFQNLRVGRINFKLLRSTKHDLEAFRPFGLGIAVG